VRTVDPYGLVENAGRWYLLAGHRGSTRTFRVSRIVSAEALPETARRPDGLDLAAQWDRIRGSLETGESIEMRVAVERDDLEVFRRLASFQVVAGTRPEEIESDDAGRSVLRLTMRARRQAIGLLLTMGGAAELLEPADLRAELVDTAARALRAHA
jgi:predicted DNA-binding transcriptional regulator YafY